MTTRRIELTRRSAEQHWQLIRTYQLDSDPPLVRIGSAPDNDLAIASDPKMGDIEPLHLLLRANAQRPIQYELINVSTKPVTLYRPSHVMAAPHHHEIQPDAGAIKLVDHDYVEFGADSRFQLTYYAAGWLEMTVELKERKLKPGKPISGKLLITRYDDQADDDQQGPLHFTVDVQGLDPKYSTYEETSNNLFGSNHEGRLEFTLACKKDCPSARARQRLHFSLSVFRGGKLMNTIGKGIDIEIIPCGTFELEFSGPAKK